MATANQEDILLESSQKEIGRIAAFVFDCIKPYTSASTMDEIYDLCGKLKHKYYRPTVWERIIDRIVGASE